MKVFVGYDTREDIAYQVCKHSIIARNKDIDVRPLKQQELRDAGWYTRPIDKLASTEFTFTRFLIPELTNYEGWAVFMDSDMILTTDIKELEEKVKTNPEFHANEEQKKKMARRETLEREIGEMNHYVEMFRACMKEDDKNKKDQ